MKRTPRSGTKHAGTRETPRSGIWVELHLVFDYPYNPNEAPILNNLSFSYPNSTYCQNCDPNGHELQAHNRRNSRLPILGNLLVDTVHYLTVHRMHNQHMLLHNPRRACGADLLLETLLAERWSIDPSYASRSIWNLPSGPTRYRASARPPKTMETRLPTHQQNPS